MSLLFIAVLILHPILVLADVTVIFHIIVVTVRIGVWVVIIWLIVPSVILPDLIKRRFPKNSEVRGKRRL
jgi:hypothetical protein